jgi:hypothetical protein
MKPTLTLAQQNEVCAAVAQGATLSIAAAIAGCTEDTINNTAELIPDFRNRLKQSANRPTHAQNMTKDELAKIQKRVERGIRRIFLRGCGGRKKRYHLADVICGIVAVEQFVRSHIDEESTRNKLRDEMRKLIRRTIDCYVHTW